MIGIEELSSWKVGLHRDLLDARAKSSAIISWSPCSADLVDEGYSPGDCLYFIALAYYALGDYSQSRQYCERLLRRDPANGKALALHDVIKEAASKGEPCLFVRFDTCPLR